MTEISEGAGVALADEDAADKMPAQEERVRICMSCCRRPATRMVLNVRGRRQYRCETCYAKKNVPGFKARRE